MRSIKKILIVGIVLGNYFLATAQNSLSENQDRFMRDVIAWAESMELKPTYDGSVVNFSNKSALYFISFLEENGTNAPYWVQIARTSEFGTEMTKNQLEKEMVTTILFQTPFKVRFDDEFYVLYIDAAYESSESFLSILPYYIDCLENTVAHLSEDSSCSSELERLVANMIHVDGGSFTMGKDDNVKVSGVSNIPAHKVVLSPFWISKYEVTQALWEAVMHNNPSQIRGANRPVENVSWVEVNEFIKKLNQLTGLQFRLPTEAEWEYAAKGGPIGKGYVYPGGNELSSVAWMLDNSMDETHDVGSLVPNELGLYDMGGNVSEWCSDWLGRYSSLTENNPVGPSTGSQKVYRGGNWLSDLESCGSSYRRGASVDSKSGTRGFRLAMDGTMTPRNIKTADDKDGNADADSAKSPKTAKSPIQVFTYENVQVRPTFKNGTIAKFAQWVEGMMEGQGFSGDLLVEFTVNIYGGVGNVVMVKGAGKKINEKTLNIVKSSPNWTPGKNNGKAVPVRCRVALNLTK